MPRSWIVSLVLLCLLPWLAAAQAPVSKTAAKTATPTATITEQDNGKDIDLTTGEALMVKLPSNPSTGYSWSVVGDPAPLMLEKSSHVKSPKSSGAVGAPRMTVLRFSAGAAGMSTLTLVYRRPWEYNVAPAKTFSVRVNVR